MTNMTLKELIEYERELCSLQQEYEGKLTKIYGEADSSNEKRRLTIVLDLIIEERQKVNRQKYIKICQRYQRKEKITVGNQRSLR